MSSPARRFLPDGDQHVTIRSPIPASPANVSGPCAGRLREPTHLREPTRDERRLGVVAQREAVRPTGGERDDVLRRRAELDADDVVGHVDAEEDRVDRDLHAYCELEVVARHDGRGREPARRSRRRCSARRGRRPGRSRTSVESRAPVAGSRPFVRLRTGASPGSVRRPRRTRDSEPRRRRARRLQRERRRSSRRRSRRASPLSRSAGSARSR